MMTEDPVSSVGPDAGLGGVRRGALFLGRNVDLQAGDGNYRNVFGSIEQRADVDSGDELLNAEERRRIGAAAQTHHDPFAFDGGHGAAAPREQHAQGRESRQMNTQRRDLHIGLEPVAQILLGLLPDVGLDAAAHDGARNQEPDENNDCGRSKAGNILLST